MSYHKRPYSYSAKKANFYERRSTASSHVISGSCFLTDVLARLRPVRGGLILTIESLNNGFG